MDLRTKLALIAASFALCTAAGAQQPTEFQYLVKFVCGQPTAPVVAPGTYFTAINVHNTSREGVVIRKRFSVALPGEKAGPLSDWFEAKLDSANSFEIDCPDILKHLKQEKFAKGFAIIESKAELEVVAVYTAAGATKQVETMEVQRVQWRRP